MIKNCVLPLALLFSFIPLAQSADIVPAGVNRPTCEKIYDEETCISLALVGNIERGDAKKIHDFIEKIESAASKNKHRVGSIYLKSPGGSVSESLAIGRLIRAHLMTAVVGPGDSCASACVLVLAGGVYRFPNGNVLIHSFYHPDILGTNNFEQAEQKYTQVANTISAYLKEMRISGQLLEKMMRVPHSTFRELQFDELVDLGLIGPDPVYEQAKKR